MCDDLFGEDFENSVEADNDIVEDMADENGEEREAGEENLIDEPAADPSSDILSNSQDIFGLTDALVLGSMIAGNAYDSALEEKRLIEQARQKK